MEKEKKKQQQVPSVRSSNFHILINTNQTFSSQASVTDAIRCLFHALKTLFCDVALLKQIVTVHTDKRPGTTFELDVGRIVSEATIEYAKTGLHAHILMRGFRLTYVRINLPVLRTLFMGLFASNKPIIPLKNPYIHVDAIRDSISNVRNYIYKNVGSRQIRYREGSIDSYPERQEVSVNVTIANMSNTFSQPEVNTEACETHGTQPIHQPATTTTTNAR